MASRLLPQRLLYPSKKLLILYPHHGSLPKIRPIPEHAMDIQPITAKAPSHKDQLMAKAEELEATFLSEMLSHTGLGETQGSFGGGEGEDQFASFLRQEQAKLMVKHGGLGLAQLIFDSMVKAEHDNA
jgi:peptidoglycan hydrolase FlgJ